MYIINVEENFSAAHNLRGYKGQCEELHGHNWKVRVEISGRELDKIGMIVDFRTVKRQLNKLLAGLDHKYLNQIPYFKKNNPTSECIAQYIYNSLKVKIPQLKSITIWESDNCSASYTIE
ncbi:MAG: 6-carboxytetrahydropterin synthase QueD [Candidatus Omnitrophota bacterium]